jgi:hypothetical protein
MVHRESAKGGRLSSPADTAQTGYQRTFSMNRFRHVLRPGRGVAMLAALLLAGATTSAQVRVGSTFFPKPSDGTTRRFPAVAFDAANNAYLVVWGIGQIGARFVSANGAPLGSPVQVNGAAGDGVRVACGADINACLIAWVQEPTYVIGRLVRFNAGAVQFLTNPFIINANGAMKLSSAAPGVAFSSAANEFLVAWTDMYSMAAGWSQVKGQRISAGGGRVGGEIPVATTSAYEGFPSLTYNLVQNEYLVAYYLETGNFSGVATQRVQPGTGALIGGRSTLYGSAFDQYPEIAYNRWRNEYLAVTWGWSGNTWALRGLRASGNAQPLGSASVIMALKGGGDGIGLAFNQVSGSYLAVYLSQINNEIWGVEISGGGAPGTQAQMTSTGTRLATQPRAAGATINNKWLLVASDAYTRVMGQLAQHGTTTSTSTGGSGSGSSTSGSSCTTIQPASNWTCVNGNWLPPTTTSSTSSCTTPQPASGWTCVSGNWLPPSTSTSSCTTPQPASGWTCVNGNWLPPTSTSTSSCTTIKPGANWTCVNGNWLPPGY